MSELTRLPVRMLSDLVSPRALERILLDAAQARGKRLDTLDTPHGPRVAPRRCLSLPGAACRSPAALGSHSNRGCACSPPFW